MMARDLAAIMDAKPLTVQQRSRYTAVRDKYLELVTLIENVTQESKVRTKSTDLLAESAMWLRTAIEQGPAT